MRSRSLACVLPFAVFLLLLSVEDYIPLPKGVEYPVRVLVLSAILWLFSRDLLDFRVRHAAATILVGIGVFLVWIAPDLLWPSYRQSVLFRNALTGSDSNVDYSGLSQPALLFRTIRAVVLVPIIEELFWRFWLMRWLINPRFETVPLGSYQPLAFWVTALLFASEHGRFWDVGLAAGIVFNLWMIRTRSLGDCILAHAVTNALLCTYVLLAGKWQYW